MDDFKVGDIVVSTSLRETERAFGLTDGMVEAHEKQFQLKVTEVLERKVRVTHPSFPYRTYVYKPSDLAVYNPIWCKED